MGNDPFQMLFIAGGAAALLGFGAYYLAQYLKGSITISLQPGSVGPGQKVEGSFELETRKEIRGNNLTAALIAVEAIRERNYKGRTTTRHREIYRSGQTIEHAKVYPAGFKARYDFSIPVPSSVQGPAGGGSFLGGALEMLGSAGRSVNWKIEVRLDAEGVDLSSSERITVNDSGLF